MVTIKNGMRGLVILTITDSKGLVIVHETVRSEDVEVISARVLPTIR